MCLHFVHSLCFISLICRFISLFASELFSLTISIWLLLHHLAFSVLASLDPCLICLLFLPSSWPVPQLEPSQIRLIVYQDCERRGRNVLFDSNAKKRGTEETPITVSHMFVLCGCCHLKPILGLVYGNEKTQMIPGFLFIISGVNCRSEIAPSPI